ncbi:type I methionyl aminopeptidase [Dissulfurirhabdus thermomarina]|uniref:Methionine aminopeptidase n=1 Tax=Dissulfurirhabdus thermomarina TaxID=1765737 RepID=A0A6N9TJR8_DISTH|nr:type I methionyl aminopeptidase [Dissulfurirhabdus thermomarina]NDY41328.1 type I methionyl aminopeptidase [Dissulfurirhabdus thermomarina]NMX23289.1 type I methionyl aminopeptidase [Dissulfurirhabdus thermomarina]
MKAPHRRIVLKAPWEIERLRAANRVVAEVLAELAAAVGPGQTTADLDRMTREGIERRGGKPAFLGYHGYPASLCVSINEEVVHGIPSPRRRIADGDLVSMDVGAVVDGYYGDAALSVIVGEHPGSTAARLVEVTRRCLDAGIAEARPGRHLQDISAAIQGVVEAAGFSVVRKFVGHGIGTALHEPPEVPNFGRPGQGPRLRPGMVLAIEPMVNEGGPDVRVLEDGWTAVTADGKLSAHFEHSVAITEDGPVVLSRLD